MATDNFGYLITYLEELEVHTWVSLVLLGQCTRKKNKYEFATTTFLRANWDQYKHSPIESNVTYKISVSMKDTNRYISYI